MDEKQILEREIDQLREEANKKEENFRKDVERQQQAHTRQIEDLQKKHEAKRKFIENEK